MKRASKITSFFFKKHKVADADTGSSNLPEKNDDKDKEEYESQQERIPQSVLEATLVFENQSTKSDERAEDVRPPDICSSQIQEDQIRYENDVALHIGTKPSDRVLATILESHWEPPAGYNFPFSEHNKGHKIERRFLKREHLEKYKSWLALSPSKNGLFCKVCPFFASGLKGGHHGGVQLNTMVVQPLQRFSKLLGKDGDLESHSKAQYHQQALQRANDFLVSYKNPEKSVENQVDTYRLKRVKVNRKKLAFSLQNVIFLGRQNISFRGRRDDGSIFQKNSYVTNKGNFKELMKFRVQECGETELLAQCTSDSKRGSFLSKTVQNDLIECCGQEIVSEILCRIQENRVYSIGFDETTDLSHKSQMTIFVRYVYRDIIREDFIGFINPREPEKNLLKVNPNINLKKNVNEVLSSASDSDSDEDELGLFNDPETSMDDNGEQDEDPRFTGEKIGKTVLNAMRSLNLDLDNCVGIATDGCSVMVSEIVGAVTTIKKECINAERAPCFSHALNLSISKCSNVQSVRNSIGIIKEVVTFFSASPKRNSVLIKHIGGQLISMCETRWVERHLSIESFLNNFENIMLSLEQISQWSHFSSDISSVKAKTLLCAVTNGEFILTLVCLADVLSQTLPLSRFFQKETIDIVQATDLLTDTLSVLKEKRQNAESEFRPLYKRAHQIAEDVGSMIKVPRITAKQVNRSNVALSNLEDYFRVNIFVPILDSLNNDLKNRFSKQVLDIYKLNSLLPKICSSPKTSVESVLRDVQDLARKFFRVIGGNESDCISNMKAEMKLWTSKWKREMENGVKLPCHAVECLQFCTPEIFPSIRTLLLILSSLPVSTATAERSFSTLKLIKTWLRNRCGQTRLTGLALLYVHRDITIDREKVIDRYIEKGGKRRKIMFS